MRFASAGKTASFIARRLGVAEITAKKALSHIYAKLGVNNRAEAASRFDAMYGEQPAVPEPPDAPPPAAPEPAAASPVSHRTAVRTLLGPYPRDARLLLTRLSVSDDLTVHAPAPLSGDANLCARLEPPHAERGMVACASETA